MLKKVSTILGVGAVAAISATTLLAAPAMAFPVMSDPSETICDPGWELDEFGYCFLPETEPEPEPEPVVQEVIKEIIKEVPVEKIVEKEVVKEVPVEKVVEKEVVKEVPVEKVATKEVVKEVPVERIVAKIASETPEKTEQGATAGEVKGALEAIAEALKGISTNLKTENEAKSEVEVPDLAGTETKQTWSYWWVVTLVLGFAAGFALMAVVKQSKDDR